MSRFVKISYPSQSNEVNEALKECIMYIGNHYGNNRDNLYKSGVDYLAKKVKGASKTAVRRMVYSKKIKNHAEREWHFRKKIYAKTYIKYNTRNNRIFHILFFIKTTKPVYYSKSS